MKRKAALHLYYVATILAVLAGIRMMDRAVTAMAENQDIERTTCIFLDPGHGGEDGGAVSVSGKPESSYNLEIAHRLRDLLQLLGYEIKMTRDTDISVYTQGQTLSQKKISDLKERVRMINSTPNALLLSIHQNSFPDGRYSGPQVFYAGTEGSEALAKQLQKVLSGALSPGSRRMAKKATGIYLMEHIQCTGVLIECGFLSHFGEEALLRDAKYQKKISALVAAGVVQYLSNT